EPFRRPYVSRDVERGPRCMSAAEERDIRLMDQAREGNVDAFSLLVGHYRERVESFLFRLFWDREKAEDGAQEVFLRLWLSRGRYHARARFTTFLFQVAHNYWLDQVRKSRSRPAEVELAAESERQGGRPILRA